MREYILEQMDKEAQRNIVDPMFPWCNKCKVSACRLVEPQDEKPECYQEADEHD